MLMYKVLGGKWECPWMIAAMVTEIQGSLQGKQFIFQHILRKENQLQDYLENITIDKKLSHSQVLIAWRLIRGESSTTTNYNSHT